MPSPKYLKITTEFWLEYGYARIHMLEYGCNTARECNP